MSIPHPGMHGVTLGLGPGPRHSGWLSRDLLYRGTKSVPHRSDYGGSRETSGDLWYRGARSVPHWSANYVSTKTSSDLGISGSRTESYDSVLGGSRTTSSDSVCGGSSTASTSTHSTSHLVKHQKMTIQPHAEGEL